MEHINLQRKVYDEAHTMHNHFRFTLTLVIIHKNNDDTLIKHKHDSIQAWRYFECE